MGLLSCGTPLNWEDTHSLSEYIRQHGIQQFINVFHNVKTRKKDILKWGDELEYQIVFVDHQKQTASLCICAEELLTILQKSEEENPNTIDSLWRMEFASYMIEGTPGKPFCCDLSQLNLIETSLRIRREDANRALMQIEEACGIHNDHSKELMILTYAAFPRIGCANFTYPPIDVELSRNVHSRSLWFPDEGIFGGHPRFINLTRNIRQRKGKKPQICVPVWKDVNSPSTFIETIPPHCGDDGEGASALKPDHVLMDCMGFGMGCSCLQITLQAKNICEARNLYDQLLVMAPLLMALSAASPAWKGVLCEWDCRWKIISMSVDDRTKEELEINPETGYPNVPKSRYDSASMFIHPSHDNPHLNDTPVPYRKEYYTTLTNARIDSTLAKHVSHLFIRDSISMFAEKVILDDEKTSDHFENIQSTNWQTVRFKPPPPDSDIGWRVEFRPLECQVSDFENTAYIMFIILFTRVVTVRKLDITMPISMVDANMETASIKDSATNGSFHFRTQNYLKYEQSTDHEVSSGCDESNGHTNGDSKNLDGSSYSFLTLDEIMNGTARATRRTNYNGEPKQCLEFPGLIPIILDYLETSDEGKNLNSETRATVIRSLDLISKRASGEILTTAAWMREFFTSHPNYQHDSQITNRMVYDLSLLMNLIASGEVHDDKLLGSHHISCDISPKLRTSYQDMIRRSSQAISINNGNKDCSCSEKLKPESITHIVVI